MILYRITKERQYYSSWGTPGYRRDKHEVVITERKGRVTQCLNAAKRENCYYERTIKGHKYRCLVEEMRDGQWEFYAEVEYPE